MNEFESLVEKIREQFPDAQIHIDSPEKPKGNHWLDVKNGEKSVTVEWRPAQGFGFYAADAGYGEGPQEIIPDMDEAFKKVVSLLQ
jgi:hypothetical protein